MDMNPMDIQKGMDVYSSDGQKIGSVGQVWRNLPESGISGQSSTISGHTGGGPGTLGDESRVSTDTGVSGGPGSLGDESRVADSYAAQPGLESSESGLPGTPDLGTGTYEETDIVMVEEVPTSPTGGMQEGYASASAPAGVATGTTTSTGYFEVDQGGILGIGAKHLYVPFSAVDDIVSGDCVTLNCSKDDAGSMFSTKPAALEDNS